jgi:L-ribulose-5-phosphate 3-epimerase UlaE
MNQLIVNELKAQYNIVDIVDLNNWDHDYESGQKWLETYCRQLYKEVFLPNERIVFLHSKDFYVREDPVGIVLKNLQVMLNEVDISNAFVILVSSNANIDSEIEYINNLSQDLVPITVINDHNEFIKICRRNKKIAKRIKNITK